jgi:threonine/homoserine/homoserine lactone efflux protein
MLTAVLAFAGVAALINVTPGLDTLLVVRTSAVQGRRVGAAAAVGILVGCLVWGLATAAGLTALLAASHLAYDALRIAGAGYLGWLGVSALVQARRERRSGGTRAATTTEQERAKAQPRQSAVPRLSPLAAFRSGLGTNLLNPKAGIFYMSLIPQFIPHGAPAFSSTLLLTGIDLAELVLWYWLVTGAAHALSERIRRPAFRRRMEQLSGVAFLGFAAELLLDPTG